jgi:glycerol-3-phosphate cytidylyltransferase
MKNKIVVTFGTFDIFHVGHLRLLEKARAMGTHLVVGVSTDKLNFDKKGRYPVYSEDERKEIILSLKCVDSIFDEESLEKKGEYLEKYNADYLVMGDDWEGKFDVYSDICEVVYFQRTPAISTTEVIEKIRT